MPELDDVNDMAWDLRGEVNELQETVKQLRTQAIAHLGRTERLENAIKQYARLAPTGAHSAREVLLDALSGE